MAEKPTYEEIFDFGKCLEIMGYTPDRDATRYEKCGAYLNAEVTIRRTTKGEFKDLDYRIIMTCFDGGKQYIPYVVEFKQCKALSVEYVKACEERAQHINAVLDAAFRDIMVQGATVDPKAIIAREKEAIND